MIPHTEPAWQTPSWQQSLSKSISSMDELCRYLQVSPSDLPFSEQANSQFQIRVPLHYASLIEKGNPNDPLLLQILPSIQEVISKDGFHADPVGDLTHHPAPGIIHKYHGRALAITTGACAIHCRYCFRRHFPYSESAVRRHKWHETIEYLNQHPEVDELILSGGDPLTLSDNSLFEMLKEAENIKHLHRVRIHTRVPTTFPERVTEDLITSLTNNRFQIIMVVHVNHPRELSDLVIAVLEQFKRSGILLLNQSVLLSRINDSEEVLIALSHKLFESGVLPYYLHMLDRVQGAAHFEVSQKQAINLHKTLLQRLPGYLVPRLVQEKAGEPSKLPVTA